MSNTTDADLNTVLKDITVNDGFYADADYTELNPVAVAKLKSLLLREREVDRLEVIDGTGRAYVKGSIYGSPVKIELNYQDDRKTLKVFVTELSRLSGEEKTNELL